MKYKYKLDTEVVIKFITFLTKYIELYSAKHLKDMSNRAKLVVIGYSLEELVRAYKASLPFKYYEEESEEDNEITP